MEGVINQIFTLKEIVDKPGENKRRMYVGFTVKRKHMITLIGKHYGRC